MDELEISALNNETLLWTNSAVPNEVDWDRMNKILNKYAIPFDRMPRNGPTVERDYLDDSQVLNLDSVADMML